MTLLLIAAIAVGLAALATYATNLPIGLIPLYAALPALWHALVVIEWLAGDNFMELHVYPLGLRVYRRRIVGGSVRIRRIAPRRLGPASQWRLEVGRKGRWYTLADARRLEDLLPFAAWLAERTHWPINGPPLGPD